MPWNAPGLWNPGWYYLIPGPDILGAISVRQCILCAWVTTPRPAATPPPPQTHTHTRVCALASGMQVLHAYTGGISLPGDNFDGDNFGRGKPRRLKES